MDRLKVSAQWVKQRLGICREFLAFKTLTQRCKKCGYFYEYKKLN